MRSAEYWAERAERVFLASEKKGTELNRALIGFYSDTSRQLQKEIDAFYGKYAVNNAISLEDARKRLNDTELKSFKEELGTYLSEVKRLGLGKDYEDYLRKLSSRAYISRQQELFAQARHQVEVLFGIQNAELEKTLVDAFHDSYYHTMFDVQQGLGFGSDFARLNTKQIEALIRKPWLGENYSDRVWNNKARLIKQLERVIPQAFALGENSRVLGKQLAERLGVSERAAVQLVRTEVNHAANEATIRSYREAGVEYFQLLATLDTRTSDICQSLDGKIFRVIDAAIGINQPPLHPNCRSTIIPWFPPDELDGPDVRAARNSDGSYYTVPGNMNYREWKTAVDNGIIGSGVNVGRTDGYTTVDGIKALSFSDGKAVNRAIATFKRNFSDAEIEHALVISPTGKAYSLTGTGYNVNTGLVGADALKGSRIIHNHPPQYFDSFSEDDFASFFSQSLSQLEVISKDLHNVMRYEGEPITETQARELYQEANFATQERAWDNKTVLEYPQIEIMRELAKTLEGLIFYG